MKEHDDDSSLGDSLDLETWSAQAPPADFADRVLAKVTPPVPLPAASARVIRPRRWAVGLGAVAIAAAVLIGVGGPPSRGEAIAKERVEVALGKRALAVLEPGATVRWNGDDVVQSTGDVFYRVEPGARFTVHTPSGDVEVKGTCFTIKVRDMNKRDIKVAATSTVLSALAFVAVYEGKVAVSYASERVELKAGEAAETSANGVRRTTDDTAAAAAAAPENDDPTAHANKNLVRQVSDYRSRLEALAKEKSDLETRLQKTEATLAAANDGAPVVLKHSFDLGADDWKELAKDGTIKYQEPCIDLKGGGWTPSPEKLDKLGLAPSDGPTIKASYQRSSERLWATIKPLCTQALGGSAELADRMGPDMCASFILSAESDRDPEGTKTARREVGEIRAGTRPMPATNAPLNPVTKLFLAMTGSSKSLEDDLAQAFGPDEAHRLVYSDNLCMGHHTYGGGGGKK